MGGVRGGYEEGPSAGVKNALVNRLVAQEEKANCGKMLTWTGNIVGQWMENFQELLNMSTWEEAQPKDSGKAQIAPRQQAAGCGLLDIDTLHQCHMEV